MREIRSKKLEDTKKIAIDFAQKLQGADIIALNGELGAGKTSFVQFIAKELGVAKIVNSPTFVIMKVYDCKHQKIKKLVHIDAYRLESENDLEAIGAIEYFERDDSIVLIEWAEKVRKILPKNTIHVNITEREGLRHFHFSK